jgi:16S rRNA (uracil1498-N3)-methyltransferase
VARLFLPPEQIGPGQPGQEIALADEPHRYLARVLRLRAGDALTVFDGAGSEIDARVVITDARRTVLALGDRRTVALAGPPVILLQAIAKGERMDLVVQKSTELGVRRICPVVTARTVLQPGLQPGTAGKTRLLRWRTIAQEAARQCGRADLPAVDEPQSLEQALRAVGPGARLMAWEAGAGTMVPLRKALRGDEPAVTLLVGAEGGFTAEEAAAAAAAGFTLVGLGPRILRSETAAIVAVALVQAALGALDGAPPPG